MRIHQTSASDQVITVLHALVGPDIFWTMSGFCPNFVHFQSLSNICLGLVSRMSLSCFCPGFVSYFQLLSRLCPIFRPYLIIKLAVNLQTNFGMAYFFIYNLVTLYQDKNWTNLGLWQLDKIQTYIRQTLWLKIYQGTWPISRPLLTEGPFNGQTLDLCQMFTIIGQ